MQIKMLSSRFGAGGVLYAAGTTPTIEDGQALQWIGDGVAVDVGGSRAAATDTVRHDASKQEQIAGIALVSGAGTMLLPTGYDDSSILSQFVQDMAASGFEARLGAGDFVVGTPMTWRSREQMVKWGGQGIGMRVRGNGPGSTRLLSAVSGATPLISINAPTAAGIGKRNYLTDIGGMSIVRAPSGVEIATGSTSGSAIYAAPLSETLEVFHTGRFKDLFIDGFDYGITLSDATLAELDTVWFCEFVTALRLGYNVDICKIRHGMFGSEQFGASYRNSAIGVQTGFNDGISSVGGENIVEIDHCWFMKIGVGVECANNTDAKGIRFKGVYFEDVRQYFRHVGTSSNDSVVSFEKCHFSKPTTNDTAQSDPLLANYQAKIQFDGDPAVTGGKRPVLSMRDNTADGLQPANAWVSFNARNGHIILENNSWRPSASFGHVRCVRTPNASWRSVPADATAQGGQYVLSDSNQNGMGLISGTPVEVSATITAASTYELDTLAGNVFFLTLPDGDCTITTYQYTGTAPNRSISALTKWKVILIVPASVGGTRTITWGSRLKMNAGTLTYAAGNVNQRAVIVLEGYSNSGSSMQLASAAPAFVA